MSFSGYSVALYYCTMWCLVIQCVWKTDMALVLREEKKKTQNWVYKVVRNTYRKYKCGVANAREWKTPYVPAVWQRPVIPTLKVEAGGIVVQGHPCLYNQLEAGLDCEATSNKQNKQIKPPGGKGLLSKCPGTGWRQKTETERSRLKTAKQKQRKAPRTHLLHQNLRGRPKYRGMALGSKHSSNNFIGKE